MKQRRGFAVAAAIGAVAAMAVGLVLLSNQGATRHIAQPAPTATSTSTLPSTTGNRSLNANKTCAVGDLGAVRAAMPVPRRLSTHTYFGDAPLLPAPPGATPAVSGARAWNIVQSSGDSNSGSAQMVLAIYNATMPATVASDGALEPQDQGKLVWAIRISRTAVPWLLAEGGPIARSRTGTTTTLAHPPCVFYDYVSFVDAVTGAPLASEAFGTYK